LPTGGDIIPESRGAIISETGGDLVGICIYAHEVAWGRFEGLEEWCTADSVPFARWSGAYGSEWGAERVVFTGSGAPTSFAADEDNDVMIGREAAERLGSMQAIRAQFDAADFAVPPLIIGGSPY